MNGNKIKKEMFLFLILSLTFTLSGSITTPTNKISSTNEVINFEAQPFNLTQVRLLDGPFKDAMELDKKYCRMKEFRSFLTEESFSD